MNNRFKHLAQQNDDPHIPFLKKIRRDPGSNGPDNKQKRAVDILKITLRTAYTELVAIPDWILPDEYTMRLAETIRDTIRDSIKYNNEYLTGVSQEENPLPSTENKELRVSDKLIYDLINDINKTYKEK